MPLSVFLAHEDGVNYVGFFFCVNISVGFAARIFRRRLVRQESMLEVANDKNNVVSAQKLGRLENQLHW
jgi:hypothetical protein